MNNFFYLLIISFLLISCTNSPDNLSNNIYNKDTNSLNILINQFSNNIEKLWGLNEVVVVGPKNYIIYTDQYKTRSHINFKTGIITVETITINNPITSLQKAIINTLLMSNCPNSINMNMNIDYTNDPFLYDQVLDNHGNPIRWTSHATKFAYHLLQTNLKIRNIGLNKIFSIKIQLVPNNLDKRALKYLDIIRKASQRYDVDQSLILAIIHAESNFNPFAISQSEALGLMQIVRHSAGRDVFKMQGKWGYPTRRYLFDPEKNIDIGTAYLSMLYNYYLSNIINPISRCYAVITAYNSGVKTVLKIFSDDQNEAFQIINSMLPSDVYRKLYSFHPSKESRRYLYKVNSLQKHYKL